MKISKALILAALGIPKKITDVQLESYLEFLGVGSNGMLIKGKRAAPNDTALFESQSGSKYWLLKSHDYSVFRSFACYDLLSDNYVYAGVYLPRSIAHGYLRTNQASTYHFYWQSWDTAYRTCIDIYNGLADIPRAGDITFLADKKLKVGNISVAGVPTDQTKYIPVDDGGVTRYIKLFDTPPA